MGRAAKRKHARAAGTPADGPTGRGPDTTGTGIVRRAAPWIAWALAAVAIVLTMRGVVRQVTWYLAVDQFGYLQFAHDLLQGRVHHDWAPAAALAPYMPKRTDVLVQTYVYDHGRMYCRYAPGFPILLAGWIALFGEDGAHYLNPTLFAVFLVVILLLVRRLGRSRWRAVAAMASLPLYGSFLHYWALTLTRDLAAHLVALAGLLVLAPAGRALGPRRTFAGALALGYAGAIRPDAPVYLLPAGLLVLARWHREGSPRIARSLAAATLGLVLGMAPALAYNWVAVGNPFTPTQGMELKSFLPSRPPPADVQTGGEGERTVGHPPGGWRGGTVSQVQGGGLRLENFPRVFPGNIRSLVSAYGPTLLGLAVWGTVVTLVVRPLLFVTAVPYGVAALFLYSCWARPDTRYLLGVHVMVATLIVEGAVGTLDLVRRLARLGRLEIARTVAGVFAVIVAAAAATAPAAQGTRSALPLLANAIPAVAVPFAILAAVAPRRRWAGLAGPILAAVVVAIAGSHWSAVATRRAPYQKPEVERARATLRETLAPNAVVITSEDVGRPAENVEHYSGVATALYLTDLQRWRIRIDQAAMSFLLQRMPTYLLIPPNQSGRDALFADLDAARGWRVERVATIPPDRNYDYFVAAPFHRGIAMELWRIRSEGVEKYFELGGQPPRYDLPVP